MRIRLFTVALLVALLLPSVTAEAGERVVGKITTVMRMTEQNYEPTLAVPEGTNLAFQDDLEETWVTGVPGSPNVVTTEMRLKVCTRPATLSKKEFLQDAARKVFIESGILEAAFQKGARIEYRFKKKSVTRVDAKILITFASGTVLDIYQEIDRTAEGLTTWWWLDNEQIKSAEILRLVKSQPGAWD